MNCLAALTFYLAGGLGIQDYTPSMAQNSYDYAIGELTLTAESCHYYVELKHISGINTAEPDAGINALMSGYVFSEAGLTIKAGVGRQVVIDHLRTNNYGNYLFELSAMAEWEGLYIKASKVRDIHAMSAGFIKRFQSFSYPYNR